MNGKRAKAIAKRTQELMDALDIKMSEGVNSYSQEDNCVDWVLAEDPDGKLLRDPDGGYLRMPKNVPGTIRNAWTYREFYQWLKRMYKRNDDEAMAILNASPNELFKLAGLLKSYAMLKN